MQIFLTSDIVYSKNQGYAQIKIPSDICLANNTIAVRVLIVANLIFFHSFTIYLLGCTPCIKGASHILLIISWLQFVLSTALSKIKWGIWKASAQNILYARPLLVLGHILSNIVSVRKDLPTITRIFFSLTFFITLIYTHQLDSVSSSSCLWLMARFCMIPIFYATNHISCSSDHNVGFFSQGIAL